MSVSSVDCKTATWNRNLQPEIEINEYSSTRGSPDRWPDAIYAGDCAAAVWRADAIFSRRV